jgi:glycosyltransferase involved in cell wall biosynthesis
MTRPNAAIYYSTEAFDTSRPRLMGRHAAGEGFLRGFIRHGGTDRLYCYATGEGAARDFTARVRAEGGTVPITSIPFDSQQRLKEPGCLFYPTVGIDALAWRRRRHDQRAYSLVGITHTIVTSAVIETIANWLIAPVQPWDAVICTSKAVRSAVDTVLGAWMEYLKARFGAAHHNLPQLPIIPLGVDCDAFNPMPAVRAAWRQRLQIGEQDIAVLFLGRLSFHAKAHPVPMYRGLQQALEQRPLPSGAKLHLIQAGWFPNSAIERAFRDGAAVHCPDVVCHFLDGRQTEVRSGIWQAADIYTSLSDNLQESFGLSPIEGMAAGLPAVVSDWDGYRDTVRDGIDGFRVPTLMPPAPYGVELADRYDLAVDDYDHYIGFSSQLIAVDTSAAAAAYATLMRDTELRKRMGAAAAAEARARFDWRIVVKQIQELWAHLAERRRADNEVSPLPDRGDPPAVAIAHMPRPDPFLIFAGYASVLLAPNAIVTLVTGTTPEHVAERLTSPLCDFATSILPDTGEMSAVVQHLAANGPTHAAVLAKLALPDRRDRLYRGLVWMAKMDLVRIAEFGD